MMQRVFDVENEKDMALLWSILPNYIDEIRGLQGCTSYLLSKGRCELGIPENIIKIRWHDKTRIIRPIKIEEATEADVGKLCVFWDSEDGIRTYGILQSIGSTAYRLQNTYPYSECYHHCRRLTKQEIEELC